MSAIKQALEQGEGILRFAPNWVPRDFCIPGRRIKLHPDDYYAYGAHRGGIDERWFCSTTKADNGPLTTEFEGLSFVVHGDERAPRQTLFGEVVATLGAELLGERIWEAYGGWPMYAKFFDNMDPIPFHMHQRAEHAALVGMQPKPEAYYYPRQLNNHGGVFPYTFFGFEPGVSREDVRRCLEIWDTGDNHITELSRAYKLELGTGWYVPAGLLHGPGSLCTYEPQWASDVSSMWQSLTNNRPVAWDLLVKHVPADKQQDLEFLLDMVDWEANGAHDFRRAYWRPPVPVLPKAEMLDAGYEEYWITYGNDYFAAKELSVLPGREVTIRDSGPYGLICIQGHGALGRWPIEAPALIRFGQTTYDEYFVSAAAAREGVTLRNPSPADPLVILKHFAPHPDAPGA